MKVVTYQKTNFFIDNSFSVNLEKRMRTFENFGMFLSFSPSPSINLNLPEKGTREEGEEEISRYPLFALLNMLSVKYAKLF